MYAGVPLLVLSSVLLGAFVMGLGYHTTEQTQWAADGTLITDGTWEYKIPSSKVSIIQTRDPRVRACVRVFVCLCVCKCMYENHIAVAF